MINGIKSVDSIEKTVNYAPNGRIIPVDPDNKELKDVKQPIYKTSATDATQVESGILLPKVKGYNCDLVTITPEDPGKDTKVTYKPIKKDDVLVIKVGKNKATDTEAAKALEKPAEEAPAKIAEEKQEPAAAKPVEEPKVAEISENPEAETQEAVINFINLDQNGKQLTSSGVLRGMPGESINDLYSSEIPLKVIKKAGYKVVFNNFDIPGVTQRFSNNKVMIKIFTIGLSKKDSTEGNN